MNRPKTSAFRLMNSAAIDCLWTTGRSQCIIAGVFSRRLLDFRRTLNYDVGGASFCQMSAQKFTAKATP